MTTRSTHGGRRPGAGAPRKPPHTTRTRITITVNQIVLQRLDMIATASNMTRSRLADLLLAHGTFQLLQSEQKAKKGTRRND